MTEGNDGGSAHAVLKGKSSPYVMTRDRNITLCLDRRFQIRRKVFEW